MPDRSTAGDFAEEVGAEALEFALDLVGAAVPGTGVLVPYVKGRPGQAVERLVQ
jgi:hypothetical protein